MNGLLEKNGISKATVRQWEQRAHFQGRNKTRASAVVRQIWRLAVMFDVLAGTTAAGVLTDTFMLH